MQHLRSIVHTITNVFSGPQSEHDYDMSSPTDNSDVPFILVLDNDPISSKYICPLSTCCYESVNGSNILNHMWKFNKKNPANKSCTGRNSPALTLYPTLFTNPQFECNTLPIFSAQYPNYDWKLIQKHIDPSNPSPPNIVSLIQDFQMFITADFLQNYPSVIIPHDLQHFVIETDFDPLDLPSRLRNHSTEPPAKKRKLSPKLLSLPVLNDFDINHNESSTTNNIIPTQSKGKNKRRTQGPVCSACAIQINPCRVAIRCTECEPSQSIICVLCFKMGREYAAHKRFHRYNVLRPLYDLKLQNNETLNGMSQKLRKIAHERWTAIDEWNLMKGLRTYGLGNWTAITKIINGNDGRANSKHFDYKHVESHFHLKYGHNLYLKDTEQETQQTKEVTEEQQKPKASSVSAPRRNNKKHRKYKENEWSKRSESKFTDKHKLKCGYRELRNEFEAEWNNDAEAMIGDMYFSAYDTEKERALKLEGIRLYNNVLEERKNRRKFIKQYGVLYQRKNRHKRNMSEADIKLEEHIANNLSMFACYTEDKNRNFAAFRALVQGLMEEKRLREKIYKYKHYLLNGITSIEEMNRIEKYVQKQQELNRNRIPYDDDEYETDEDDDITAEQYMNQYHGCSLDAISKYLKLLNRETLRKRKKNNIKINKCDNGGEDINEIKWDGKKRNLKKMRSYDKLHEGEKKICDILKISPTDYKYIEQQIEHRVRLHGLLNKNKIPQPLTVDIENVKDVKKTMTMKIGLVDPRVLITP